MTGFALPNNYIENPEELLRKNRSRTTSSSATPPTDEPVAFAPSASDTMAQKTLREFSVPAVANMPARPTIDVGDKIFKLRTRLITMVQANPFYGLPSEDANAHLQHFLELCDTIVMKDVTPETMKLRLFPFSFVRKAK